MKVMNRQRNAASPPINVISRNGSSESTAKPAQLPAWNREQLIHQLQGIDGSTRSEAELQLDAFERSFWDLFADSVRERRMPDDPTN
jgi:hypothetical protein